MALKARVSRCMATVGALLALGFVSSGCGGSLYAYKATGASSRIEEAKALGAERYAPYEYYYALAHLEKASEEAASANYGDAIDFADVANEYAEKAVALSRDAHAGGGR
jgi:hypothetical protein